MSTDWHLTPNNIEQRKGLIGQQIQFAKKLGVTHHICLGDVFQSRQSQPLAVLIGLNDIFNMLSNAEQKIYVIPGNHDKTDYNSKDNFLMPFEGHWAAAILSEPSTCVLIENHPFVFMPFFEKDIWIENYKKAIEQYGDSGNILISHIAVDGSTNNDGSKVSSPINPKMFSGFKKVFLGHYHNQQQIGENVFHLPSIAPKDFGEDNNKGFTILYSDYSTELIKAEFKEFITVKVDLDEVDIKTLNGLKKKYANSDNNIRFKIVGSEEKIKSIKKDDYSSLGIDIKTELTETEFSEPELCVDNIVLTNEKIIEEFKLWCEKESKDCDEGLKYLNKKLKV